MIKVCDRVLRESEIALDETADVFKRIFDASEYNTRRVLEAFGKNRVSDAMFAGSTGYGYGDIGRESIDKIYAEIFGAEAALVRIGFVNGTHAICCAMFAGLKCGDTMLSATGAPYDTLMSVVSPQSKENGCFNDYGIKYKQVELLPDGTPDIEAVKAAVAEDKSIKKVFIQRSGGYSSRRALSCSQIGEIVSAVKSVNPNIWVVADNCYGEFTEKVEPCHVGADLVAGSLIKNPGGGLAPCGGYIAGKAELVNAAAARLTTPGIGGECGATLGANRQILQGIFMAPHIVGEALKTAVFCAALMERLGFDVCPKMNESRHDIIQNINFGSEEHLLRFCQGIQAASPVDSFAVPEPWDMPGYDCKVVMAAGAFNQGSSIELSCDAPMREPFTAYLQGGLTFEAGKYGILCAANNLFDSE